MTLDEEQIADIFKTHLPQLRAEAARTRTPALTRLADAMESLFVRLQNVARKDAAELAALKKATIERCAKVAETTFDIDGNDSDEAVAKWNAGNTIAAAIRALPLERKDGE